MIRNALAAMLSLPLNQNALAAKPSDNAFAVYMIGGPTTHEDGSVTWNPPKRYDRAFDGTEGIVRLPQKQVPDACRQLFKDAGLDIETTPNQRGCAVYKGKNGTIIAVDRPFRGSTPEAVIRHERGHLNGWKQSHPD